MGPDTPTDRDEGDRPTGDPDRPGGGERPGEGRPGAGEPPGGGEPPGDRADRPGDGDTPDPHPILADLRRADGGSAWTRFTSGFTLSFRAVALLKDRPGLWPYVLVPALINAVLFVGAVTLLVLNAGTVVGWVWSPPAVEAWYDWALRIAWYLLVALVVALSVGVSYVLTLLVGGLVAGPFRDALSTRAERILLGTDDLPEDDESFLVGTVRGVVSDLLVIGAYVLVMLPVVLLNLVPAVGSVASSLLGTVVSAFFLAFEFANDPLDRRDRSVGERFALLRERRATAFGFGFGTTFLFWIPLLNFLTIPLAVVGGTAMGIALDEWDRDGEDPGGRDGDRDGEAHEGGDAHGDRDGGTRTDRDPGE